MVNVTGKSYPMWVIINCGIVICHSLRGTKRQCMLDYYTWAVGFPYTLLEKQKMKEWFKQNKYLKCVKASLNISEN